MDDVLKGIGKLQWLLNHAGAQFMSFDTDNRRTTMLRIHGFVARLEKWIHTADGQTPEDVSAQFYLQISVLCLG